MEQTLNARLKLVTFNCDLDLELALTEVSILPKFNENLVVYIPIFIPQPYSCGECFSTFPYKNTQNQVQPFSIKVKGHGYKYTYMGIVLM